MGQRDRIYSGTQSSPTQRLIIMVSLLEALPSPASTGPRWSAHREPRVGPNSAISGSQTGLSSTSVGRSRKEIRQILPTYMPDVKELLAKIIGELHERVKPRSEGDGESCAGEQYEVINVNSCGGQDVAESTPWDVGKRRTSSRHGPRFSWTLCPTLGAKSGAKSFEASRTCRRTGPRKKRRTSGVCCI